MSIITDTKPLRDLICAHPDLPVVVVAGPDARPDGDSCTSYYCSDVHFHIGEMLDYDACSLEKVYTDRGELEEDLMEMIEDSALSDDDVESMVAREMERLAPYWRNVIIVYADN